jgi:hypothetical protein
MGADLYIKSVHDKAMAKYNPLFEKAVKKRDAALSQEEKQLLQKNVEKYYTLMNGKGYFRDSYNGTALFQYLYLDGDRSLSWWADVIPMLNRQGNLTPDKAMDFLNMIYAAELRLPTKEQLLANRCQVDDSGGVDSVEGWHKYIIEKRQKLIDFLSEAIVLNEDIDASL